MVGKTLVIAAALAGAGTAAEVPVSPSTQTSTTFHYATIEGVKVFYREAGPKGAPTLLLLHGFPSSSAQFATLMPLLADTYHVIAPDYPGFGLSDAPPPDAFAYTFDHVAAVVAGLIDVLGVQRYVLYMNDYGGPVGFRLALAHPERVMAMIVQNAVAHEDGLGPLWAPRRAYWHDRAASEANVIAAFTSLEVTRDRHLGSSPHPERYDPNTWLDEYAHLSKAGQAKIQADLFYDYRTNVASYASWQDWMRQHKPPMLVVWGKYDPSFTLGGAAAYGRDVPEAEIHILEAGHFALEEAVDQVAALSRAFLAKQKLHGR